MRVILLIAALFLAHAAGRELLEASSPAPSDTAKVFVCGAPEALCGDQLPAGVTCEKGPGWCQPGYYCGYRLERQSYDPIPDGDQRCRPLGDCGQAGAWCCPSNANSPHTSSTDKLARKPFCKDGNICLYNRTEVATTPLYAGVRGSEFTCQPNPKDCGTHEGAACCPSLLIMGGIGEGLSTNPPSKQEGYLSKCADKMFCHDVGDLWTPANEALQDKCFAKEPPKCGTFGNPCCKVANPTPKPADTESLLPTGWTPEVWSCGAAVGSGGPFGWCDRTNLEPYGLCMPCPPKEQLTGPPNDFRSYQRALGIVAPGANASAEEETKYSYAVNRAEWAWRDCASKYS